MPRQRRGGVSLASHAAAIEKAFRASGLVAVAIVVNSPGGSPVQSALLYRRIRQLAEEKSIPVIAFAEDVAASGGYWLALAGDEIFSEETSLVGSIGVISAGFGLHQLIGRLGIERRLHTAGERKSLLDPFLPEEPSDIARLTALQQDIHQSFKDHVRHRRAGKIDAADEALFGGRCADRAHGLEPGPHRRHRRRARSDACPLWRSGQAPPGFGREAALVFSQSTAIRRARTLFPDRRSRRLDRGAASVGEIRAVMVPSSRAVC
jgi:ClpP class serine protease